MRTISNLERRGRLAHHHRLTPENRTDDVKAIADGLVALHSSDPASVFLSAGLRMASPSIEAIEDALYEHRSLVRHHAMRRTLWVMSGEVAALAHASSSRKVAATERRTLLKHIAESLDVADSDRWLNDAMAEMMALVETDGPIMTRQLGERLPALRLPLNYPGPQRSIVEIAAHTKVIQLAGFEGQVIRTRPQGSWVGSQYAWAPATGWFPEGVDDLDTHDAQARLVDRWLRSFGPGTSVDLAWWTGWTKTDVKRALQSAGAEPVRLESGDEAWVSAHDSTTTPLPGTRPWVAVLPGLDPTPMGWKERDWYLADDVAARVVDRNGNIGPTVWADGEIVGGWAQLPDGEIALELQRPLSDEQRSLIDDEVGRITELVGDTRFRVRFPSPNQRDLLAD